MHFLGTPHLRCVIFLKWTDLHATVAWNMILCYVQKPGWRAKLSNRECPLNPKGDASVSDQCILFAQKPPQQTFVEPLHVQQNWIDYKARCQLQSLHMNGSTHNQICCKLHDNVKSLELQARVTWHMSTWLMPINTVSLFTLQSTMALHEIIC